MINRPKSEMVYYTVRMGKTVHSWHLKIAVANRPKSEMVYYSLHSVCTYMVGG